MKIASINAWQIFDSRGAPTVEAEVILEGGVRGRGLTPSGASTGQFEALELRDGDPKRFRGKSVFKAISNIQNEIGPLLKGANVFEQATIDKRLIELDGTPNKARLGANAILAVSMAVANAAAAARNEPLYAYLGEGKGTLLPVPEIQIIGGGVHANWRTDVQDLSVIAIGAQTFTDVMELAHNVFHAAGDILRSRNKYSGVAEEGGFWPEFDRNEQAIELLVEAISRAGYTPGRDAGIGLDIASSELYDERTGRYQLHLEQREFTSREFGDLMESWCNRFPILLIEDPMSDTDRAGWQHIMSCLGGEIQIIGDDLFTTNVPRIRAGIDEQIANSVLIKLNQVGTVTETIEAIRLTQSAGWQPMVSGRSGDTEDHFICHLAVATNAGQIKVGGFSRSERMVKWNEVLRIERELGPRSSFLGFQPRKPLIAGRDGSRLNAVT